MNHKEPQSWAIVGGGMLGLTLAHRLTQQGHQVTVFEAAPELGGLASAWQVGDVVWDRHYHVTLLSDSRLRNLLDEIGLEKEMKWVETKTGFYTDGQLYSMSNTFEFLNFPPLTLIEKLRLGATIFYASKIKNWKRLEKMKVTDWLRRWSGRGTFEKIWLPLLRAKLGENYNKTSASFIWAHIDRMYKARRTGLKKEMFGYVPGGYARILQRLGEVLTECGAEIRLNQRVQCVAATDNDQVSVHLNENEEEVFDHVVLTAPSTVIGRVCPALTDDEKRRFLETEYQGIICASVLLKKPLAQYYVTNITDSWVPLTAVIEMSTIVDPAELGGHSLVYLPKYVPSDDPAFAWTDEHIEEKFLGALDKMYPHFSHDDVVAFRISRVRNVMALPTLRCSERMPPMKTSIPGVYAVNSAQILKGNLNVNQTIQVAEDALGGVLATAMRHKQATMKRQHNETADRQLVAGP